ncbi:MAG: hypothetical protein H0W96_01550 [Solirubrobacterales bacterium]|nr:hypothetical protein [Solirubrobacterales bacterium]
MEEASDTDQHLVLGRRCDRSLGLHRAIGVRSNGIGIAVSVDLDLNAVAIDMPLKLNPAVRQREELSALTSAGSPTPSSARPASAHSWPSGVAA